MREIKFRAWDSQTMRDVRSIHNVHSQVNVYADLCTVKDDPLSTEAVISSHYTEHNLKLRIMQYTGLKDKNGVEIYEGDILQRPSSINSDYHGEWIRDEVIYKPGVFFASYISSDKGRLPRGYTAGELLSSYFEYDGKLFAFSNYYEPRCVGEVIGNIYENPELLKAIERIESDE